MAKRFDFSSEKEKNDASSYIDASQNYAHSEAELREATKANKEATAVLKKSTKALLELNTLTETQIKFEKMLDEKAAAIENASYMKFSQEALDAIAEIFNSNKVTLISDLKAYRTAFIHDLNDKARSILSDISTRDSRVAMRRSDYWQNRLLNVILILSIFRLIWIDIETGITSVSLWHTCEWTLGLYIGVLTLNLIVHGIREK